MLKYLMIGLITVMALHTSAATHILQRDYDVTDVVTRPLSVGITTLHYKERDTVGAFGSVCCMTMADKLRLELGVIFAVSDRLDAHILTGLATPILDDFTLGVWYASFWNTYHPDTSDDPWGIMVGYRF